MEGKGSIVFKATNNGLILIMNNKDSFEEVYAQIEKKLGVAGKFFKGASLLVKYRGRRLTDDEEKRIRHLMSRRTEAEIIAFEEDQDYQTNTLHTPQNDLTTQIDKGFVSFPEDDYFKGIEEGVTKFYRGTVRSGQLINFNGNVIVLGDVNPGAEIEATGNIIILGALKGTAHAGLDGNRSAIIVALDMQPVQIRIADIITRSPDDTEKKVVIVPEMAYIKDKMIYIEKL